MNFSIVGNRDGHAAIHWPGVFLAALLITAIYAMGVVAVSLAVGWFSSGAFVPLPILVGAVIGNNIKRGLQMPPEDLPSLS